MRASNIAARIFFDVVVMIAVAVARKKVVGWVAQKFDHVDLKQGADVGRCMLIVAIDCLLMVEGRHDLTESKRAQS